MAGPGKNYGWLAAAVWLACSAVSAQRGIADPKEPEPTGVGRSRLFDFHESFWLNLHDRLYERVQKAVEPTPCGSAEENDPAWRGAESYYRAHMASRHHRTDPLMRALRLRLVGLARDDSVEGQRDVLKILAAAADSFSECYSLRRAAHRTWLNALLPRLQSHEEILRDRLVDDFKHTWPDRRIRVDIVGFASWGGANTVVDPHHIMMSSINDGYQEWSALEMVFHEASHILVDGENTPVGRFIVEASSRREERPPANLWHAILFYTVGSRVRQQLSSGGVGDYQPYVYRRGLFDRAWRSYRQPIETHWKRYLDGELGLEEAVDRVVEAVLQNQR